MEFGKIENFLKESFTLNLRPQSLLIGAGIWCYLFNVPFLAIPTPIFHAGLLLFFIVSIWLYRDSRSEFRISGSDALVFLGMLAVNFVAHLPTLFYSLGGDELYHAGRSLFPLEYIRQYRAPHYPYTSIEVVRGSMWQTFDLSHLAVIDVWRALSVLLIMVVVLAFGLGRFVAQQNSAVRWGAAIAAYGLLVWLGGMVALAPESHPPLRLFPLFISATLFGLNSFAFRVSSLIALSVVTFFIYKFLRASRPNSPQWWRLLVATATSFIPVVFYVGEAVEPSVYGYATYIGVLLLILRYWDSSDFQALIWAGVVAGLGMVLRQSTVVLWIPLGIVFLFSGKLRDWRCWAQIFAPFIIGVPYFLSVSQLGHTAAQGAGLSGVVESLRGGVGVMSVLNSTTLPWLFVIVVMIPYIIRRARGRELSLFLVGIPAYVLFHTIWIYLWGLGRYQAEYAAPFVALILILQAIYAGSSWRKFIGVLLPILCFSTVEVSSNLSLDVNYAQWPRMRITTSANFPYREALSYVKRAEAVGDFILLGGTPWNGDVPLWLSGHSFYESWRWLGHQDRLVLRMDKIATAESLKRFCERRGIRFVVVQSGTRRERQHRSPGVHALIEQVERAVNLPESGWYQEALFSGEHGGILTVYSWKSA